MGYWISYLGVGYGGELRPYFGDGGVLLFALPVVIAGLLTPALALTGFAWTRKHPYGPFALLLVIAGLLIMSAGFPEGTPLQEGVDLHLQPLPARPVPADDVQGGAAGGDRAGGPGRAGGAAHPETRLPGRGADPPAGRELAADPRPRRRRPAPVGRDPRGVAGRGDPRRPDREGRTRRRPARPALRLLRLGRDDRPDPARAGGQARRDPQRRRVRRPARDRPAVDGRRARAAAPRAPRPARPAARPARRPHRHPRRRRGPHPQRRDATRRGRGHAPQLGEPTSRLGRADREATRRGHPRRPGRAPAGPRLGPARRARARAGRGARPAESSSTAPPKGSPRPESRSTASRMPPTSRERSCAARSGW